jgi:paraquat-inducible protein A
VDRPGDQEQSLRRTVALALAGLILYFPAMLLPVLIIERLGHTHTSSILTGVVELLRHGEYFVGIVIFLFSVVIPPLKLAMLLILCTDWLLTDRHRAWTYRLLEQVGRWGMLDVLLVALLVALVKLGDLVHFEVGVGAIFFALCVVMSMLASATFKPEATWERIQ